MQLENIDRIDFNLQVSHLKNVSGSFEQEYPFLIKVLGENAVTLSVKMASDNEEIETVFEPGWNVEIVKSVSNIPAETSIQIGY